MVAAASSEFLMGAGIFSSSGQLLTIRVNDLEPLGFPVNAPRKHPWSLQLHVSRPRANTPSRPDRCSAIRLVPNLLMELIQWRNKHCDRALAGHDGQDTATYAALRKKSHMPICWRTAQANVTPSS